MMQTVRGILTRAGVAEEDLPSRADQEAVVAATIKWLLTTDGGSEFFSHHFCLKGKHGDADKDYAVIDNVVQKMHTVKNTDVWFFEGVLVRGQPMPISDPQVINSTSPYELDIISKEKNKCEGCGIISHCVKEILDPFDDQMKDMCNFCITYHEHPKVNDIGGLRNCEECSVINCRHHPVRLRA